MSGLAQLRAEVEERVQQAVVPLLMDRAIKVHRKRAWRHCDCNVCRLKRLWHDRLQFAPHFLGGNGERRSAVENWRWSSSKHASEELDAECEKVLSPSSG